MSTRSRPSPQIQVAWLRPAEVNSPILQGICKKCGCVFSVACRTRRGGGRSRTSHSHEHDHDQGGRGWVGRVRHALSEAVGGHSHDAADQLDDVLEADAAGRRALVFSLAGLGLTAAVQAVVVVLSGSVALLGDTLAQRGRCVDGGSVAGRVRFGAAAADRRLTYGYGRAEDLGGVVRGRRDRIVVCLAAYESVRRLIHPESGDPSWRGRCCCRGRLRW